MSLPINPLPSIVASLATIPDSYAGIYDPCRTLINEHRPVCTYQADLYGKYLDVTDNPDVWFPLPDTGAIAYATKNLTLTTAVGAVSAVRAVINTNSYPITANMLECTFKLSGSVVGIGGIRYTAIGFGSAFSTFPSVERAAFYIPYNGASYVGYRSSGVALTACPLGRNLQAGDICTVRLDRQKGSANIDIVRFYVNGTLQYETTAIPQTNCYCGIGVYGDADVTTARSVSIDYFGFRYVP